MLKPSRFEREDTRRERLRRERDEWRSPQIWMSGVMYLLALASLLTPLQWIAMPLFLLTTVWGILLIVHSFASGSRPYMLTGLTLSGLNSAAWLMVFLNEV
jgi:hypothetical protein